MGVVAHDDISRIAEVLLTSETSIKDLSSISDNVAGKYIKPSIREAQDIKLREIIGDTLLNKLKELVADDTIYDTENDKYRELLDKAKYFINYSAIVEISYKVAFKIANAGIVKTPDERVDNAAAREISEVRAYYQAKADAACIDLQNFIMNNWKKYPELNEGDYYRVRDCLYSAATCGIFLGGARGKVIPKVRRCRR